MKIAWLAAVQPPYREPMWREVAARCDLKVSFLFREERTRHFTWRASPWYRSAVVRSRVLPLPRAVARRFDEPVAVLAPGVTRRMLDGADALMIHVWWQPANLWSALRARLRGIPYMIYAESTLDSREFSSGPAARIRSLVFRNAGAVIVPGPSAAEAAVADGAHPDRVVESVNSVDLDVFDERVRELRDQRPADALDHRFLYVGQLIARKNVATLVRAFAGVPGEPLLDIAGDGVEMGELTDLAEELGVADRVRFLGHLAPDDVVSLLAEVHTAVLPSTEEVYGYTALEGYVAGLQVIVSARAGVAANLEGRPGTWVVEPVESDLRQALEEARKEWPGWREDTDLDFASPQRVARDIVRAVGIANRR